MIFAPSIKHLILPIIIVGTMNLIGCSDQNFPASSQTASWTSTVQTEMSAIETPTSAYTPTNTIFPTATFKPIPSLEPTQAKGALQKLLINQELCQPPCFWGVTPYRTTLGEAQNIFSHLGLHLTETLQTGEKAFYATSFGLENGLVASIVLRVQDDLVDSLRTNVGFTNYSGTSPLQESPAFSPKTIVTHYGIPTHVEFYIAMTPSDGSSPKTIFYEMVMYFDSSDLVVKYGSKLIKDENIISLCPLTDNLRGINVWLGKDAEDVPQKEGVPLEEATALTLEEFNDLILQKSAMSCFNLNRDAFQ